MTIEAARSRADALSTLGQTVLYLAVEGRLVGALRRGGSDQAVGAEAVLQSMTSKDYHLSGDIRARRRVAW